MVKNLLIPSQGLEAKSACFSLFLHKAATICVLANRVYNQVRYERQSPAEGVAQKSRL